MLRRRAVVPALSLVLGACGTGLATPTEHAAPSSPLIASSASTLEPRPTSSPESSPVTAVLPPDLADFPVPTDARPLPVSEGSGLIARWAIQPGSSAYRFYREALPAAGYRITTLGPGGNTAIIRFEDRGGAVWQIDIHGDLESALLELSREHP
jgi:hypothetical protein